MHVFANRRQKLYFLLEIFLILEIWNNMLKEFFLQRREIDKWQSVKFTLVSLLGSIFNRYIFRPMQSYSTLSNESVPNFLFYGWSKMYLLWSFFLIQTFVFYKNYTIENPVRDSIYMHLNKECFLSFFFLFF